MSRWLYLVVLGVLVASNLGVSASDDFSYDDESIAVVTDRATSEVDNDHGYLEERSSEVGNDHGNFEERSSEVGNDHGNLEERNVDKAECQGGSGQCAAQELCQDDQVLNRDECGNDAVCCQKYDEVQTTVPSPPDLHPEGRTSGEYSFDLEKAFEHGAEMLQKRDNLEKQLEARDLYTKPYTSEGYINEFLNPNDKALSKERKQYVIINALKFIAFKDEDYEKIGNIINDLDRKYDEQYPNDHAYGYKDSGAYYPPAYENGHHDSSYNYGLRSYEANNSYIDSYPGACKPTKYRTYDGRCNNLDYPNWGRAFIVFDRLLPANYGNGVSSPRKSTSGDDLPNPRLISSQICRDTSHPVYYNSLMVMQWGQFINHDIDSTPVYKARGGHGLKCCAKAIYDNSKLLHPECLPIKLPQNDYLYQCHKNTYGGAYMGCMEFTRSLAVITHENYDRNAHNGNYGSNQYEGSIYKGTYKGKREQINQVSSYIDASHIYGVTEDEAKKLRSFKYGDSRANMHPWLTGLHNLFARYHNYIAYQFYRINPEWDDEHLYQEARRVIGATLQYITYYEFLPALLGPDYMDANGLTLKYSGYSHDYDHKKNPTALNEFATAAFRVGHSLIYGIIEYHSREYGSGRLGWLRDKYFVPYETMQPGMMDKYFLSLMTQWQEKSDTSITHEVTRYLFKAKNETCGQDLVSFNINRGRDHGIPGYNEYRKFCGYKKAHSFDDLYPLIDRDVIKKLAYLYKSVDDIDLFIGGIAEIPVRYSLIGPTFSCIIATQFRRLKKGDRFWHELGGQPSSFTSDQLQEIRKIRLGTIICHFCDKVKYSQKWVFKTPGSRNPYYSCNDSRAFPQPNLQKWKTGYHSDATPYEGTGDSYGKGGGEGEYSKYSPSMPYHEGYSQYGGPYQGDYAHPPYGSGSHNAPHDGYSGMKGSYPGYNSSYDPDEYSGGHSGYNSSDYGGYKDPSGHMGSGSYGGYKDPSGHMGSGSYGGYKDPSGHMGSGSYGGYKDSSGHMGSGSYGGYKDPSGHMGSGSYGGYKDSSGHMGSGSYGGYSAPGDYEGYNSSSGYGGPGKYAGYPALGGNEGYGGTGGYPGSSGYDGYSGQSGYGDLMSNEGYGGKGGYNGPLGDEGYSRHSGPVGYVSYDGHGGYGDPGYGGNGERGGYDGHSGQKGYSGSSGYGEYGGKGGYNESYGGYESYGGPKYSGGEGYNQYGGYRRYGGHSGKSGYGMEDYREYGGGGGKAEYGEYNPNQYGTHMMRGSNPYERCTTCKYGSKREPPEFAMDPKYPIKGNEEYRGFGKEDSYSTSNTYGYSKGRSFSSADYGTKNYGQEGYSGYSDGHSSQSPGYGGGYSGMSSGYGGGHGESMSGYGGGYGGYSTPSYKGSQSYGGQSGAYDTSYGQHGYGQGYKSSDYGDRYKDSAYDRAKSYNDSAYDAYGKAKDYEAARGSQYGGSEYDAANKYGGSLYDSSNKYNASAYDQGKLYNASQYAGAKKYDDAAYGKGYAAHDKDHAYGSAYDAAASAYGARKNDSAYGHGSQYGDSAYGAYAKNKDAAYASGDKAYGAAYDHGDRYATAAYDKGQAYDASKHASAADYDTAAAAKYGAQYGQAAASGDKYYDAGSKHSDKAYGKAAVSDTAFSTSSYGSDTAYANSSYATNKTYGGAASGHNLTFGGDYSKASYDADKSYGKDRYDASKGYKGAYYDAAKQHGASRYDADAKAKAASHDYGAAAAAAAYDRGQKYDKSHYDASKAYDADRYAYGKKKDAAAYDYGKAYDASQYGYGQKAGASMYDKSKDYGAAGYDYGKSKGAASYDYGAKTGAAAYDTGKSYGADKHDYGAGYYGAGHQKSKDYDAAAYDRAKQYDSNYYAAAKDTSAAAYDAGRQHGADSYASNRDANRYGYGSNASAYGAGASNYGQAGYSSGYNPYSRH